MNDDGDFVLNSTVAHICARSEGGPRWNPDMSEAENQSSTNLIALCQPHSFEVDQEPLQSVGTLRNWKAAQIAEHQKVQKSWTLTNEEAQVVVDTSFGPRDFAVEFAAATAITKAARTAGLLAETAVDVRRLPNNAAAEWRSVRSRVARNSVGMWDATTGESIRVEPSRAQADEHNAAMNEALAQAAAVLRPMVIELVGDLHAVHAAAAHLRPWCEWIESAAKTVVAVSEIRPELDEDKALQDALQELSRATTAISTAWRGEPSEQPPSVEPQLAQSSETESEGIIRSHKSLLDLARPWARVVGLPYDQALCERLMVATRIAIRFPCVPSFLSMELGATAGLAAAVARNSDDAAFMTLIENAAAAEELAVAVHLLREFMFMARETGRVQLETQAMNKTVELLGGTDWTSTDIWVENRFHMVKLLNWAASVSTTEGVRSQITAALAAQPKLLVPIVLAVSTQSEVLDPEDYTVLRGIYSRIRELPEWLPTADVLTQIRTQYSQLLPSDRPTSLGDEDEFTALAQHLLYVLPAPSEGLENTDPNMFGREMKNGREV